MGRPGPAASRRLHRPGGLAAASGWAGHHRGCRGQGEGAGGGAGDACARLGFQWRQRPRRSIIDDRRSLAFSPDMPIDVASLPDHPRRTFASGGIHAPLDAAGLVGTRSPLPAVPPRPRATPPVGGARPFPPARKPPEGLKRRTLSRLQTSRTAAPARAGRLSIRQPCLRRRHEGSRPGASRTFVGGPTLKKVSDA